MIERMRGACRGLAEAFCRWADGMGPARLRRLVAATAVVLLVAALVPLAAISFFNHSYADDWHYGVQAHLALQQTESVASAVRAALVETAETYVSWQGTYSAIFLMSLQPGVFGEGWYALSAPIVLAALVASTAYAARVLVLDVLRSDRSTWALLTCTVLLLQTQLMPSPVEGVFWYNSAIYYTFYHSLLMCMVGLGVRIALGEGDRARRRRRAATLAALAFVVAGGNFVTALVALELLAFAAAALAWRRRREALAFLPALLVHACGFAASVAAPGNAERQLEQFPADALSAPMTVVRSAFAGWEYAVLWTNGLLVVAVALTLPFVVRAVRSSGRAFRLPGAVAFGSLALFATSFTPTFFSMGSVGPGRVQNARYFLFVVLVFVCVAWLAGGAANRRAARGGPPPSPLAVESLACAPRRIAAAWLVATLSLACVACSFALDDRHVDDLTSFSAASSLATGEAARYDRQVRDRLAYIEGSSSSTLEVPYYTVGPHVLFMGDIRGDMGNYINFRLAQWYGKDSVVGVDPAP